MEIEQYSNGDDDEPLSKFRFLITEYIEKTILKIAFDNINKSIDIDIEIKAVIDEINSICFYKDNSTISLSDIMDYYLKINNCDSLYDYLHKSVLDLIADYNSYVYNINIVYNDFVDSTYFDEAMTDVLNDYFYSNVSSEMKTYKSKNKDSFLNKLNSNKMRKLILYYLSGINENLFDLNNVDDYDQLYIEKLYNKGKNRII